MENNFFKDWSHVIELTELPKREPLWQKAMDFLIANGDLEPTMRYELTQEHIQEIMLDGYGESIQELIVDMAKWLKSDFGELKFYVMQFNSGKGLWLAYLMATRYAMFWVDGGQDNGEWNAYLPEETPKACKGR